MVELGTEPFHGFQALVLSQPAISFEKLHLIVLFVATKMSLSPPAIHIGDFS
jgi:hypothetical protein